jgi:hypothetical protein
LGLPAGALRTPLPVGLLLSLPAGDAEVFDDGHLLACNHQWVVAVGLSSSVFLVIRDHHPKYVNAYRLHELYGYLKACGCALWPIDFRCPLAWRLHGDFTPIRRLWANRFFDEAEHWFWSLPLPRNPRLTMALFDTATDGAEFWNGVASVAASLFGAEQPPEPALLHRLMRLARLWERRCNGLLASAQADDLAIRAGWAARCERVWPRVVFDYLVPRVYQMQSASLANLL